MKSFLLAFLVLISGNFIFADWIRDESIKLEKEIIELRRDFHKNPELSNREFKTSKKIYHYLKKLGYQVEYAYSVKGFQDKVGVIAKIQGNQRGPTVALRADIDALPVTEKNSLKFKSTVEAIYRNQKTGVMHACGHDAHTAMLMGAAKIFSQNKDKFKGTIKLIFQPAEEGQPLGEKGGAKYLVEKNVLKKDDVEAIFGIHIISELPTGTIAYKKGPMMASAKSFFITISGTPGHGSTPWSTDDPITASSYFITNLQSIVSRKLKLTHEPAVVTVGKIIGGTRHNIIPETVKLEGTIRAFDKDMENKIEKEITNTLEGIKKIYNINYELQFDTGYLITSNEPDLTQKLLSSLEKSAGKENIKIIKPMTGAEDFSFYAEKIPALFVLLGAKHPSFKNKKAAGHHTPQFLLDEKAFKLGTETYTRVAIDYLNSN